jgi:hypothetical protein
MNWIDDSLDRLLRTAAMAPKEHPGELPFPVEAHLLARWRLCHSQGLSPWLLRWLRIGLACACLLMLAAFLISRQQMNWNPEEELTMPSAVVNLALSR